MIQRYQRLTLQQQIVASRQELDEDIKQLKQINLSQIPNHTSATFLIQMIQKLSFPILGIDVLKQNLISLKYPHFAQFQIIKTKAQYLYTQSIIHDLNKIKNQQNFVHLNKQQIQSAIEEINWKMNMEKSFVNNEKEADQVGDNVDLMKFFQGVRNYQNWQQNIHKQTINKLKHKAYQVELGLQLKKGFILSKIQKVQRIYSNSLFKNFFINCKQTQKSNKFASILDKFKNNNLMKAFSSIQDLSRLPTKREILFNIFQRYLNTKIMIKATKQLSSLTKILIKTKLFFSKVNKIHTQKTQKHYINFLNRLNLSKNKKIMKIIQGLKKIQKIDQITLKKIGLKIFNVPQLKIAKIINKVLNFTFKDSFRSILQESKSNIKIKPEISRKLKGKILLSLQKYQKKPIDIRNTFYNWYIKGNQNKFTKNIYNIWLTGSVSKFTFFMRLKNLVDQNRKYKIKHQLKAFLMTLNQKFGKYYAHNQKGMLNKWKQNVKRISKIQKSFKTLQNVQQQSNNALLKKSFNTISEYSKKVAFMNKFCLRYLGKYMFNAKCLLDLWKRIPDVKRTKGQSVMRKIFRKVIFQIAQTKKEVYDIFLKNKNTGRSKKILFLRKVFNKDIIYMQKYMQVWRFKKNYLRNQQSEFTKSKERSLRMIQIYFNKIKTKNLSDVIKKFEQRKNIVENRKLKYKKLMSRIVAQNKKQSQNQFINALKDITNQAQQKKNNLVKKLVNANCKKQLLALHIIRSKAQSYQDIQKIRQTQNSMRKLEEVFRYNFTVFNKNQFVYRVLSKILANKTQNVGLMIQKISALPKRMDWKIRDNAIKFYQILNHCQKRNKGIVINQYRLGFFTGKFKMKKSMNILAAKYFDVTRKYFNIYRKNISRIKYDEIYKVASKCFENTNDVIFGNFKNLFLGDAQWQKRAEHLQKLNNRVKVRMGQGFKLWQQASKAIKYFKHIQNQKKTRYLQVLTKTLNKNSFLESKRIIHLFNHNSKIMQLQTNFLKRLCESQAGKVVKAMMIWKGLPQPKNKERIARATKFESMMAKIAMKNLRKTFNICKQAQYFGNEKKKVAIRQLVSISCSGIQTYFNKWRNNNKLSILFSKCWHVDHLIHISHNQILQNFKLLLVGDEANKKIKQLIKLQSFFDSKKKIYLRKWQQKVKSIKKMENAKSLKLTSLSTIQRKTQGRILHQKVFSKFRQCLVFNQIMKLKNKQAKVLDIVNKLSQRRRQNIGETFQMFRINHYKGNSKKNRAFQIFLKQKIRQVHNILSLWNSMSQQAKSQQKKKYAMNNFMSLDEIVKANFSHLISNRKQLQLKKKMLGNLFRTQQLKLKGYLLLWKNNVKQLNILRELDKKTKSSILERINKIVSISSTQNVKAAIKKFHHAMKIQKVMKTFIHKLLKTKSGLVVEAFNKWKSIPAINLGEKYKKAQKFYFKMENLYKQHLGFIHKVFKKENQQGNMMKKQSILQLFEMTSTGIRRYYNRWQKKTKMTHTLNSAQHVMHSMDIMQQALKNQFLIVFQDQRSYRVKVKAIQKLIASAKGTTQNYFNIWRRRNKQIKLQQSLNNQQKTSALRMFTKVLYGSEQTQLISLIRKFKINANVTDISRKFLNRLMQTKSGKVLSFFDKLKSIPDAKMNKKKKQAIIFESRLNKFAHTILRTSFVAFKQCNWLSQTKKKYCIEKLVRLSMGQSKKKFIQWRNVIRQDKILSQTKSYENGFANMDMILANHINILFKDAKRQVTKKKNLCRRLLNNSLFAQHHAYFIWKEAYHIDINKITRHQSKVKDFLKNLIQIKNTHQKVILVQGISKFRKALQIKQIQKNILKTSKDQQLKHSKAIQFFKQIKTYSDRNFCVLLQVFKKCNVQMRFANKIQSLQSCFSNANQAYSDNLLMFMRSQKQSIIIQSALNRIFANFKGGTQKAFNLWRQNAKILKLQGLMNDEKKKNMLEIINKILHKGEQANVVNTINLFKKNFKILKFQKEILMKILNCKAGKVPILFMKWKALPNQLLKKNKIKAMKFQGTLHRLQFQRAKFVFTIFKQEQYDGNVKKQLAVRKLIQATMSDSNRIFGKWRKVISQSKITQKMMALNNLMSDSQDVFIENLMIFEKAKQNQLKRINALNLIFTIQKTSLHDTFLKWVQQCKRTKINRLQQILIKFTPEIFNHRLVRDCFGKVFKQYQLQQMKGYVNSLWKWKLAHTQANYYSKFIKIFRQSEQLLNFSTLLNRKFSQHHYQAFRNIKQAGIARFNRKKQLVQKYFILKVRTYFNRFRNNTSKFQISVWKSKYTQNIRAQSLGNLLKSIFIKEQFQSFSKLKSYCKYSIRIDRMETILKKYMRGMQWKFMLNLRTNNSFKLMSVAQKYKNKNRLQVLKQAYSVIKITANLNALMFSSIKVSEKQTVRIGFRKIYSRSQRVVKCKLAIRLLMELKRQANEKNILTVVEKFLKNKNKIQSSIKIAEILKNKVLQYQNQLFKISKNQFQIIKLLSRFNKGTVIKKILQKQDKKLLQTYFNRLRKKDNFWVGQSIRRFATRSNSRSSMAISIWRIKTFMEGKKIQQK